jgi:glycosyltransferase involved in cell wall biosynthesis
MTEFSVVICTCNRAGELVGAIECVLAQTFGDFELVVVDDGSTDDTREIVHGIADTRVHYVYRENGGLSAARNTGVAASHGRYVTFLDDDDRVSPSWLEEFHAVLCRGAAVVSCGARWVTEDGQVLFDRLPADLGPAFCGYHGLFQAGTFAVTRQVYDAVGGFAEELRGSHQTEFSLRLLPWCREHGRTVGTVDEPLVTIGTRLAHGRARNAPERLLQATCYIIDHHRAQLQRSPEILANYYATAGVAAARSGAFADARRLLRQAVGSSQVHSHRWKHGVRLLVACVPPVARIVWRSDAFDPASMR